MDERFSYLRKTQVAASISSETYNQVLIEAVRRGITVSELVRHYVEVGLNNPTRNEVVQINSKLATIEGALKELYEMALMNWPKVRKEGINLPELPWNPQLLKRWKEALGADRLFDKEAGTTAYENLAQRESPDYGDDFEDELETKDILRDFYKAEGLWTEREEVEYQEWLRRKAGIKPKPKELPVQRAKRKTKRRRR